MVNLNPCLEQPALNGVICSVACEQLLTHNDLTAVIQMKLGPNSQMILERP